MTCPRCGAAATTKCNDCGWTYTRAEPTEEQPRRFYFYGRKIGALGVLQLLESFDGTETQAAAHRKTLYDRYEHIHMVKG